MPTKVHKSTFPKGINKDIGDLYMPKESYRHAENFRISTNENSTIGILENIKGNSQIRNGSTYPVEPGGVADSNQNIIGGASLDNDLIFFTYNSIDNITRIFRATIVDEAIISMELLWSDLGKSLEDKMNLSTDHALKVIARKENENVEKIYWVDYNNYLRYANIGEYLTNDKEIRSADNIYVSAKYFDTVSEFQFANPQLTKIGGGGLKVGMAQYSYQLYNESGSETSFAPTTGLYHLTTSSETSANSNKYKGSPVDEYSGKSLSFDIDLSDVQYDSIRLVAIHYEHYNDIPTINIISERNIPDSGVVSFTDNGSGYIGSYTIEQFTAISGLYKAKDIASSKNFLFMANIKQNHFDIENWDARAFRFNAGSEETTTTTTTETGTKARVQVSLADAEVSMNEFSQYFHITITGFKSYYSITDDIINITDITNDNYLATTNLSGTYVRTSDQSTQSFNVTGLTYSFINYTPTTDSLTFEAHVSENIFGADDGDVDTLLTAILGEVGKVTFSYTYEDTTTTTTVTDPISRVTESNGDVYLISTDGSWEKRESDGTLITTGTNWSIPLNADVKNPFNITEQDTNRRATADADGREDYLGNYKYDTLGNLGGVGKKISYTFDLDAISIDASPENYRIYTNLNANTSVDEIAGYDDYANPQNSAEYKSYQRDEIYRFGIIFFDEYGRESTVKWIGDIRMPSMNDGNVSGTAIGSWYVGMQSPSGNTVSKIIMPKFKIENYPEGAVSYKIVRVERSNQDRTIVFSGLVRPTGLKDPSSTVPAGSMQSYHRYSGHTGITVKSNLVEFISPEIAFYKDFSPVNNDYLELHVIGEHIAMELGSTPTVTDSYGGDVNIKFRRSAGISYSDASYSNNVLNILAGKIVTPAADEADGININGNNFFSYYKDAGETADTNPALILNPNEDIQDYLSGEWTHELTKYAVYRRHIYDAQYGGPTHSNRSNNEYISASEIQSIPDNDTATYCIASQGDTFINMYNHTALSWNSDSECVFLNFIFPVESSINLALRHDDCFNRVYSKADSATYQDIRVDGNEESGYSPLYLYNTVYSQENTIKKYFPMPDGDEFEELETFSTRIIVSERKFNGESSDSWLKFLPNNFIDVDAGYGELNNIHSYSNNLLFWQPSGFGIVSVEPRSLITDNNPGALVLGTGAVLGRFDYLSTSIGNSNDFNIVDAPRGIYWYDSILNTVARYNGESIQRLSKLKGVQSYLNKNDFDNSLLTFDPYYDEVLISLYEGETAGTTLVFNELADVFTGFYTFLPSRYFIVRDKVISSENDDHLYMHNTEASTHGTFYGTANDSKLITLINSDPDYIKVFDGINYPSYSYNSLGVLNFNNTFQDYTAYNSYQNTDVVDLTPGDNISRKKGMWAFHINRNDVTADPDTNPDIFNQNNLNSTDLFKARMRDLHLTLDFTYDNSSDYRFTVPYINTKYRISYR